MGFISFMCSLSCKSSVLKVLVLHESSSPDIFILCKIYIEIYDGIILVSITLLPEKLDLVGQM